MERLGKTHPGSSLTAEQKKALAEIDSEFEAKIAERRIFLEGEMAQAVGDEHTMGELRRQLSGEVAALEEKREQKKDRIRNSDRRD